MGDGTVRGGRAERRVKMLTEIRKNPRLFACDVEIDREANAPDRRNPRIRGCFRLGVRIGRGVRSAERGAAHIAKRARTVDDPTALRGTRSDATCGRSR